MESTKKRPATIAERLVIAGLMAITSPVLVAGGVVAAGVVLVAFLAGAVAILPIALAVPFLPITRDTEDKDSFIFDLDMRP
jgi:hypothetical protein